ncbi:MAG: FAD-dependent oxidoreductase, partial [Microthrixaceae bacterium]|nr:FAD-dependent oxidoreductase [Microthrixaceae bacterium]
MQHSTIVIGAGIGGLSAAWTLRDDPDLLVLDGGDHVGGHSDTAEVRPDGPEGPAVAVDTGFIVHNDLTYPNLLALFEHLGVERAPSDMSFAFTQATEGPRGVAEYSGSLRGLLGRGGWRRRSHWRLTADIVAFGKVAAESSVADSDETLAELATRFSPEFRDRYLYPMAAAIWSSPDVDVAAMPASSLIAFFHQHGLFRLRGRPRWSTLADGSRSYVDALVASLAGEVRHGVAVRSVTRLGDRVVVTDADGHGWTADRVVLATHADTSLALLGDGATEAERRVLGRFRFSPNVAYLHTDPTWMPRDRAHWSAWNVAGTPSDEVTVTYWMNRLQPLNCDTDLFVTLNPPRRPDGVLQRRDYTHPV